MNRPAHLTQYQASARRPDLSGLSRRANQGSRASHPGDFLADTESDGAAQLAGSTELIAWLLAADRDCGGRPID